MSKKEVKLKVREKFPKSTITITPYSKKHLNYYSVEDKLKYLSGKILTIIDGSIVNEKQNKAVKDQVKGCIWKTISEFQDNAWDGKRGHVVQL